MSQRNVERVIGRLVTDEAFRRQFGDDPQTTLEELATGGIELTPCEVHALIGIDPRQVARFADALDPRLQKADCHGGVQ